jgi:hypothetical protein
MPAVSRQKVKEIASKLSKGERTIWRWISEGLDITSEESVRQFVDGKRHKRNNVQRARERVERAFETAEAVNRKAAGRNGGPPTARIDPIGDRDLPPPSRRGAAAALERLEATEERAHARLLTAMEKGNPFQIQELQDFWLKCSETLRKLDLAVEMARRDAEEQVPKKLAQQISLYISEWLRIAFAQFLSSEARSLMGIKDVGDWKAYAIERFKGILDLTVKSSLQTQSPIPNWAADKVKEAWNVSLISEAFTTLATGTAPRDGEPASDGRG